MCLANLVGVLLLGTLAIFLKLHLGMKLILMMLSSEKMARPSRFVKLMCFLCAFGYAPTLVHIAELHRVCRYEEYISPSEQRICKGTGQSC
jgi:hypothetical protein